MRKLTPLTAGLNNVQHGVCQFALAPLPIPHSRIQWLYFFPLAVCQVRRVRLAPCSYFFHAAIIPCFTYEDKLLVCEGGDIGRAAIWESDEPMRIQNHIHRLRAYVPVCTRFFYHLFYLYKGAGWIGGKGIAIQGLSSNAIHNLLFPLPPLHEQERIVNAIDTALSVVQKL